MIGILDYGMGNIQSIYNAFRYLGTKIELRTPDDLKDVDALVLPGVGAFKDTVLQLEPYKKNITEFLCSEKPFLGICIGLQYLFEESFENGRWKGLGFFKGQIKKLPAKKLPQIGWNTITVKKETPLLKKILSGSYVYYINSYAASGENALATSFYGREFAAVVGKENVFATQFHPEKSGMIGLRILENFVKVVDQCL
ncbi:MAG: imidazole glycerol phosphate synthase subunit HisH [Petrotogales bacterium]